jgi:hypothetical protein
MRYPSRGVAGRPFNDDRNRGLSQQTIASVSRLRGNIAEVP